MTQILTSVYRNNTSFCKTTDQTKSRKCLQDIKIHTNAPNFHARTSKSPESRLSTRPRSLGFVASGRTKLNVQCSDTKLLKTIPTHKLHIWIQQPNQQPYIMLINDKLIKQASSLDTQPNINEMPINKSMRLIVAEFHKIFLTSLHIPCNELQHLELQA